MNVLFEGGPHDGGYLDVEYPLTDYIQTFSPIAPTVYNPDEILPKIAPPVRVYRYKRWKIVYPGDSRVEIRYCLDDGRKPIGIQV